MNSVPTLTIVFAVFSALLSFGLPIVLLVWLRKRTHAGILPALVGAGMFLLFVLVLETRFALWFTSLPPVLAALSRSTALYALYGGLQAGLFEETARLIAFFFLCKRFSGVKNAVSYGIGHGGIEAMWLSLTMAVNAAIAISLRLNGLDATAAFFGVEAANLATLYTTPSLQFLAAGLERVIAIAFHIAASVLVYLAVSRRGKKRLYPLAILLHAALDFPAVFYLAGVITNIWLIELIVAVICVGICLLTWTIYQRANREHTDLLRYDPL